jgi:poly(hydroxyalkanoate) depolymerase family esterase
MLQGCTQDPDDIAAGTGMNQLAERLNFLVAYPEQSPAFNQMKCWNWFNPGDQMRGQGEPAIIVGIAKAIIAERDADPSRVFVVGLSAGGAMAAVLGAAYPDVFAGIGIHSGLPYGSASDVPSAFAAMRNQSADMMPVKKRLERVLDTKVDTKSPARVIVFHGAADATVHPENGCRLFAEACSAQKMNITTRDGISLGGRRYRVSQAVSASGETIAEHWLIDSAGHAWSGGRTGGSYTDPQGPNASNEMLRFFLNG